MMPFGDFISRRISRNLIDYSLNIVIILALNCLALQEKIDNNYIFNNKTENALRRLATSAPKLQQKIYDIYPLGKAYAALPIGNTYCRQERLRKSTSLDA